MNANNWWYICLGLYTSLRLGKLSELWQITTFLHQFIYDQWAVKIRSGTEDMLTEQTGNLFKEIANFRDMQITRELELRISNPLISFSFSVTLVKKHNFHYRHQNCAVVKIQLEEFRNNLFSYVDILLKREGFLKGVKVEWRSHSKILFSCSYNLWRYNLTGNLWVSMLLSIN